MWMSLLMETIEFVTSALIRMHTNNISSGTDFPNFSQILNVFPKDVRTFVKLISESPDHQGVLFICDEVEHFIMCAVENFLKKATGLSTAEVKFQRSIKQTKKTILLASGWSHMNHRGWTSPENYLVD